MKERVASVYYVSSVVGKRSFSVVYIHAVVHATELFTEDIDDTSAPPALPLHSCTEAKRNGQPQKK
jgi:hypothetical protein